MVGKKPITLSPAEMPNMVLCFLVEMKAGDLLIPIEFKKTTFSYDGY